MRREILIQAVLTGVALILLLLVVLSGGGTYVEELPAGIKAPIPTMASPLSIGESPAPAGNETSYSRPARPVRPSASETSYRAGSPKQPKAKKDRPARVKRTPVPNADNE